MNHQNLQKRTSSAEDDNVDGECKQELAKQTGSTFPEAMMCDRTRYHNRPYSTGRQSH